MGVMSVGFLFLILNIQKTAGYVSSSVGQSAGVLPSSQEQECDPEADALCGIDITSEGAVQRIFKSQVYGFLTYLGAGISLIAIGLLLQASEEISGFLGGLSQKKRDKLKVGRQRRAWRILACKPVRPFPIDYRVPGNRPFPYGYPRAVPVFLKASDQVRAPPELR